MRSKSSCCGDSELFASHTCPQVHLNGELTHTHESYFSGTAFNTLGVVANDVTTVMLESTGLTSSEWISLIEVSSNRKAYLGSGLYAVILSFPRNVRPKI